MVFSPKKFRYNSLYMDWNWTMGKQDMYLETVRKCTKHLTYFATWILREIDDFIAMFAHNFPILQNMDPKN